jgi:eukaryotic-like serine/threonine-protein kinase
MAFTHPSLNRTLAQQEAVDPFAMQLALSTVHARLVPMRRGEQGYELDPGIAGWFELPAGRGFAGYGLGRAVRMLLDVLRGLTALHDTFDATGATFAHGDVALRQLRVDPEGVCRLVPLTARHSLALAGKPAQEALGHLAPERLLGEAVDVRSDVFSAGALLWEALAGRRLFEESTGDAIIDRLMSEKLQMPQLPPELAWAIPLKSVAARALAVDPYQRFADCAELATAIAIVARERVASHAEIATFFGAPQRSVDRRLLESVHPGPDESALSALFVPSSGPRSQAGEGSNVGPLPSQRPVPTRSSTFPAASVPSSRRTSTLAPLGPARSLTPPPSARATPAPSARPASRCAPHLSPFSTLLSAESRPAPESRPPPSFPPASEPAISGRRNATLMSLGTPLLVLDPTRAAPPESADAPPSSGRPLPLPTWTQVPSLPVTLLGPSKPTLSAVAVPLLAPKADLALDEDVRFRSWPARRVWSIALLIAVAAVIAVVAFTQSRDTEDSAAVSPAAAAAPAVPAAAQAVATTSGTRRPGVPGLMLVPPDDAPARSGVAPGTPPRAPATKAPAKAGPGSKDYGI